MFLRLPNARRASRSLFKSLSLVGSSWRSYSTEEPGSTATFGYEDIPVEDKKARVGEVFKSVAPSYDLMNDLMSGGMHHLWKQRLVGKLQIFPEMQHIDVAGGTGDVAFQILQRLRNVEKLVADDSADPDSVPRGSVIVFDLNQAMLDEGRKKAERLQIGGDGLQWIQGDAEKLPFPNSSMDSYTIAFGIRNVTHIDLVLTEAFRVLKPGGLFVCLEFSTMVLPALREIYDAYSFNVIPQIGRWVANDEASYKYLVESIRRFPDQETFADMIRDAGFSAVSYENLSGASRKSLTSRNGGVADLDLIERFAAVALEQKSGMV